MEILPENVVPLFWLNANAMQLSSPAEKPQQTEKAL